MDRFDVSLQINLCEMKPYFSLKRQEPLGAQYIDSNKNYNKHDHKDETRKKQQRLGLDVKHGVAKVILVKVQGVFHCLCLKARVI